MIFITARLNSGFLMVTTFFRELISLFQMVTCRTLSVHEQLLDFGVNESRFLFILYMVRVCGK